MVATGQGTIAYRLTGGVDAELFILEAESGELRFEFAPNFELPADAGADNGYQIAITATDLAGNSSVQEVVVNVTDVNEAPVVDRQTFSVDENSADGTAVGTVLVFDPDAEPANSTPVFQIMDGNVDGAFAIGITTGAITVANSAALDFETRERFELVVRVTDVGGETADATIVVNLNDLIEEVDPPANAAPVIQSDGGGTEAMLTVAENTTAVTTVLATDADPMETIAYDIAGGADADAFALDPVSGVLSLRAAQDFEDPADADGRYEVQVRASSSGGLSDTQTLSVTVTDVNEAPAAEAQDFAVDENSADGTAVGTVLASDPDTVAPHNTLSYAIVGGDPGGAFAIEAATGAISVADGAALDHETQPMFVLQVQVSDGGTPALATPVEVTIDVGDVAEGPAAPLIDLSALGGDDGFRIDGRMAGDEAGGAVSGAGDFNGDGFDDLIIGALLADPNGTNSGESYVVFGSDAPVAAVLPLTALDGSNGFRIGGVAGAHLSGYSVSIAGDFNGDGFDDLAIGATGVSTNGAASGAAYVVFGTGTGIGPTLSLAALDGSNGFALFGERASDRLGFSVASAGDVNSDGYDDLVVGARDADTGSGVDSGASYVLFGGDGAFDASFDLASLDGRNGFQLSGDFLGDNAGASVSSAGDVNGDGFADIIVGASRAAPNGGNSGASYVVFGGASGFAADLDLGNIDGDNGFKISGVAGNDFSGYSVSAAGDIDGDGFGDLVVGARGNGSAVTGNAYVVFGASSFNANLQLADLEGDDGFRLSGVAGGDRTGISVSTAGDINADGYDDLIIGADSAERGIANSGVSYVVFGSAQAFAPILELADLDGLDGFALGGAFVSGETGRSVSDAGDVNGDGYDDLIVGSPAASANGLASGASHVLFGRDHGGRLRTGTDDADTLSLLDGETGLDGADGDDVLLGNAADNVLVGGRGGDHLDGAGGNDVLVGGAGDDVLVHDAADRLRVDGGSGRDTLLLAGPDQTPDQTLDLTLDLADLYPSHGGIEIVDLGAAGDHRLLLQALDILHLTDAATGSDTQRDHNLLRVDGTAGDALATTGGFWTELGSADGDGNLVDGGDYTLYRSDAAMLLAQNDIDRSGIATVVSLIRVSDLDGSNGLRIDGAIGGSRGGDSVSGIGDFNGDGYEDVVVGAPGLLNGQQLGQAYVVFGQQDGFPASLGGSDLDGSNGFRISSGVPGDQLGQSVSGAGDVNGDGLDDLIVGAVGSRTGYLVFGRASGIGPELRPSDLDGTNGSTLSGSNIGSVAAAGDVNGDGLDDLIIGGQGNNSTGPTQVVFGRAEGFGADLELSGLNGETGFSISFTGSNAVDFGFSVSSAGDFNGDGFDDLLVGAPGTSDPDGGSASGSSYLIFGRERAFGDNQTSLLELDASSGLRLFGAAGDEAGISVSSAGDINGDGYADLIVGAPFTGPDGDDSGIGYVLFGRPQQPFPSFALDQVDGSNGFRILGGSAGDLAGVSVSAAGDVDGDGLDDLIIGARGADPAGVGTGAAYVVYGRDGGFAPTFELSGIDGINGFELRGIAQGDLLGSAVSGAGDLNGDGHDDLIVGASNADGGAPGSGAAYVILGGNFTAGTIVTGTAQADDLAGTAAAERLIGGNGNDVIDGGGGRDVVIGGAGDDTLVYSREHLIVSADSALRIDGGTGRDTLRVVDTMLDLRDLNNFPATTRNPENPYRSIEIIRLEDGDLRLSAADLLQLVGAAGPQGDRQQNLLRVDGQGTVNATFDTWTSLGRANADGNLATNGTYTLFQSGGANLLINNGISHDNVRQAAPLFELQALNGVDGVQLSGFVPDGRAGFSVSSAGDVNGDGFDDVIVGAPGFRGIYDLSDRGAAYVVFGTAGGFDPVLQLQSLDGSNGFVLVGEPGEDDQAGLAVSSAGDINGDGVDDLIIGAPGADGLGSDGNSTPDLGASYIVFGRDDGFGPQVDLSQLDGTNGFAIYGRIGGVPSSDAVANAGDVNGDGYDDVVIGSHQFSGNAGSAVVVYGRPGIGTDALRNQAGIDGSNGFFIDPDFNASAALGRSVSGAGDVNGDGFDDVIVGASSSNLNGDVAGASYVVFGGPGGDANVLANELDGSNGFRLDGEPGDLSGRSVSTAGDVNGDGFADLIIGAPLADPNGPSSGVAYVVFGRADGFGGVLELASLAGTRSSAGAQGFRIIGQAQSDLAGFAVSDAGDFNGDGFDDLVVSAYQSDENGNRFVGATYVVFGGRGFAPEFDPANLDGENGFTLIGEAGFDFAGRSVSAAGDVDGDGYDDLLIGAPGNDADNSDSGAAYLIFGRETGFDFGQRIVGTAGNDTLGDLDGRRGSDDVIIAGAGNDTLIHDAADTLRVDGGSGIDTLRLTEGDSLDLTALNGFAVNTPRNPLSNIERIDAATDDAPNTIVLALADLLALSDSTNTIEVLGNGNDVIDISGLRDSGIDMQRLGRDFDVYVADGTDAQLWIEQGMQVI